VATELEVLGTKVATWRTQVQQAMDTAEETTADAMAARWQVIDLLTLAYERWGRKFLRAEATSLGYSPQTVDNYVSIGRRFRRGSRREEISPHVHYELARIPLAEREKWLDRYVAEGMTVRKLKLAIAAHYHPPGLTKPRKKWSVPASSPINRTICVPTLSLPQLRMVNDLGDLLVGLRNGGHYNSVESLMLEMKQLHYKFSRHIPRGRKPA